MTGLPKSAQGLAQTFVSVSVDDGAPEAMMSELIGRCNQHQISATWAVRDVAGSALLARLASSLVSHEMALLADPSVTGEEISRSDLLNYVARPLQLAAAKNISISTLAIAAAWQPRHIDLLTKYGITLIRTPHVFSSHTTTGVRAICYGLWQVPVAATLYGGGWMANLSQWRFARRVVERSILRGGWCHVRIDTKGLATGDVVCGLRTVDRLLRHLQQLQSAGHIAVETLRDTAARLTPKRSVAGAQSILRAA
jgi:hypothetical protein